MQAEVTQKADKQGRIRDRGWKGVIGWRPWLVADQSCCGCGLQDARLFCSVVHSSTVLVSQSLARRLVHGAWSMEHGAWSAEPSVFHQAGTGCSGLAVDIGVSVDVDAGMISIDACV